MTIAEALGAIGERTGEGRLSTQGAVEEAVLELLEEAPLPEADCAA